MSKGNIPSAAVALVYGDRIVLAGAYGYSNAWARTPAFAETVYLIGSTFKTMSTFALLQQMEQGKFKLDDPVNAYLTEFKDPGRSPLQPGDLPPPADSYVRIAGGFRTLPGLERPRASASWAIPPAVPPAPESAPLDGHILQPGLHARRLPGGEILGDAVSKIHPGEYPRAPRDEGYGLRAQARDGGKAGDSLLL